MEMVIAFVTLLLGLAVGAFIVWFSKEGQLQQALSAAQSENLVRIATLEERDAAVQVREAELNSQLEAARQELESRRLRFEEEQSVLRQEMGRLREEHIHLQAALAKERELAAERQRVIEESEKRFTESFEALSARALRTNNESFLELAKATLQNQQQEGEHGLDLKGKEIESLVKPLDEALRKVEAQMQEIEKDRAGAYQSLLDRVKELGETQAALKNEAGRLVNALRAPVQRGLWGEMQLQRVVEMAGMLEHCDFETQVSMDTEEGKRRPDMIVRLPGGRAVIVDAKVPLSAYLDAVAAEEDEERKAKLKRHASQVKAHIDALSGKGYWELMHEAPDFVVAFLPGESFLAAALSEDPTLIEYGMERRVLLSTPTTLISLLKTASYGWRQEKIADNARQISDLGKEMYDRLRVLTGHFHGIKRGLETTLRAYNDAAGSMESRVLVTARKFRELGATDGQVLERPELIDFGTRDIHAPELRALAAASAPGALNGDGD